MSLSSSRAIYSMQPKVDKAILLYCRFLRRPIARCDPVDIHTVKVVAVVFQCKQIILVRCELHFTCHSILVSVVFVIRNDLVNSVWIIEVFMNFS